MEALVREKARQYLPAAVRQPLGAFIGKFFLPITAFIGGVIFDLLVHRFRIDGCQFEIPKSLTSVSYRSCFLKKTYEAEERELVAKYLRADDSVLEAGACLGIVSCVTNQRLRERSRHVVVEGNPFCIPAIHRNRELNHGLFLIENCAISNQDTVTFYLHPVYVVGGTALRETARAVRVPGRTLLDLETRYGPFSALIIDIEGAEIEAFETSTATLARSRLVIVELHEWAIGASKVERCRQLLREAGLVFRERLGITEAWERD